MIKMNIQFFAASPDTVGIQLPSSGGQLIENGTVLSANTYLDVSGWYVVGNKVYNYDGTVKLIAEPYDGYEFKYWTLDGIQLEENTSQDTMSSNKLTAVFAEAPKIVTYEHILKDSNKIQVDSAIRDGLGNRIDTKYVRFNDAPKYVHYIHIYNGGSASGSCDCYATIYSASDTKLTATDLINTYTMTNKLYNITGVVSNTNGCNAVGNVFFAGTKEAYFNDGTQTCTGTTINVEDTILGRLV